ncbi:hypothetical protein MTP04_01790 [Lysinibacillus sp. PLM2]|nr:hypothetical protein MTP04_01790 [Lysinibacillus sp. PLM2]
MELSSIMSTQVASLQQTLQMSILDKTLNLGAEGTVKLLESMPEQPAASHPYKGTVIDVSV